MSSKQTQGSELMFVGGQMRLGFKIVFLVIFGASVGMGQVVGSVLTFKEWRSSKATDVQKQYADLQTRYIKLKDLRPRDPSLPGLYRQLKNAKGHLDELMSLTVTDYFISYLSQYRSKKAVFDAAINRLEPNEVSEVMNAYANSLLKTSGNLTLSNTSDLSGASASK